MNELFILLIIFAIIVSILIVAIVLKSVFGVKRFNHFIDAAANLIFCIPDERQIVRNCKSRIEREKRNGTN